MVQDKEYIFEIIFNNDYQYYFYKSEYYATDDLQKYQALIYSKNLKKKNCYPNHLILSINTCLISNTKLHKLIPKLSIKSTR